MEITYRPYVGCDDYSKQRELFRLSFPEAVGTEVEGDAHYHWKFSGMPASPPSYQYVGDDSGVMVGYYAAIPYKYWVDGVVHRCGMVCDVMTHPGYRGRGIFTQIGRYATAKLGESEVAFTTGYPIRPEVIPGHLKVGWQVVEKMPTYVRPVSIEGMLPKALKPVGRVGGAVLRVLQGWSRPRAGEYSTLVYSREEFLAKVASSEAYEIFLARWAERLGNALVKDADFLAWRTGAPGARYFFVALHHKGEPVGLALARPTQLRGVESLAVLDFMVLDAHLDGCRALHWAIYELAREHRKDVVACMASKFWAKTYRFAGSCYLQTPSVFSLIVKKLDSGVADESLLLASRWHVFWIDSDDL